MEKELLKWYVKFRQFKLNRVSVFIARCYNFSDIIFFSFIEK